jgi:hypothetical protein
LWDFRVWLVPSILGVCVQISWLESRIHILCIFVVNLDPSNSGFCLRFEGFVLNPSFLVELDSFSIPSNLVCKPQVLWDSIP